MILDKYREDIKEIKNLKIDILENNKIRDMYNYTTTMLSNLWGVHEDFSKQILSFGNNTLLKIYSLINQEFNIYRLKDLIDNIKFLPDGKADYVGIGADSIREKNYLNLAKILIERNILSPATDKGQNNLTFQLIKFTEKLQKYIILFVDEAYIFIRYIFDNMLSEVSRIEGNKNDIDFINNFSLYYIHKEEYDQLNEKYNSILREFNDLKTKLSKLEKENIEIVKKELTTATQERDILLQKIKDDKSTIDSLKSRNTELFNELNKLKLLNLNLNSELESTNKKISENNLTIKNSSVAIESLKNQADESFGKLRNSEALFNSEKEKNRILTAELADLNEKLKSNLNQISKLKSDLDLNTLELNIIKDNHSNQITMASNERDNVEKLKINYESVISKLEKTILDEKKKYSDLKTSLEMKLIEANKKYEALEGKYNSSNSESIKDINDLKSNINELQNKLNDANKKNEALEGKYNSSNSESIKDINNLKSNIIEFQNKLNEANKKNEALEAKYNSGNSDSIKDINNLKTNMIELQNKLNDANKKFDKLNMDFNENNKKNTMQIQVYEGRMKELIEKNENHIKKILHLEEEILEHKNNYIRKSEVIKLEEKNIELNSLVFDLKCLNTALNKKIDEQDLKVADNDKKTRNSIIDKDNIFRQYNDLLNLYNSIKDDNSKKRTDEDRRIIDISIRLSEITKLYDADQKKIKEFDSVMKQEREKYQQMIFILEKQVKDLNIIIDEYHKTKDYGENELVEERKKNNLLFLENQNLNEKNKNLLSLNEHLQIGNSEIVNLKSQIEEFRIQLHSQMKQNEILNTRIEELEKELRNERNRLLNSIPNNSKMQDLKIQFDAVFLHKEKLEKELIEKKNKISQLQMMNETLNSKYEILNAELNSHKDQKNSFTNVQTQIKNYISQIDEINKNQLNIEIENTELKNKLKKTGMELDQLKLANEQYLVIIDKLKEELNEARKYEKKIEILSNSKMEIDKLKNKLEKTESEKLNNFRKTLPGSSINNSNKNIYENQEYMTLQKRNSTAGSNEYSGAPFDKSENKDLIVSNPNVKNLREKETNANNINNSNLNNSLSGNNNINNPFNKGLSNIDFNKNCPSNILLNQKHWGFLKEWFSQLRIGGSSKITLDLLMKASRDGFGWETFRDRCHRKSPTIVVVLTSFDKLIGGFTPLPWDQSKDQFQYLKDDSKKSFLFSLTNGKKYNVKNYQFAICNGNQIGPIFGGGSDLEIVDNCNINFNNFSAIGHTYEFNDTVENFYGGQSFTVKDYEVYEVKY